MASFPDDYDALIAEKLAGEGEDAFSSFNECKLTIWTAKRVAESLRATNTRMDYLRAMFCSGPEGVARWLSNIAVCGAPDDMTAGGNEFRLLQCDSNAIAQWILTGAGPEDGDVGGGGGGDDDIGDGGRGDGHTPVRGIRIVGSLVTNHEVKIDSSFVPCPTAHAAGVPLVVKREPPPPGAQRDSLYVAVRLMTDPRTGLAPPEWQPCPVPPVVAARTDGVPFTDEEWEVLDDFIDRTFDNGPAVVTRKTFVEFVRREMACKLANDKPAHAFLDVVQALPVRYPKGARVKANGLRAKPELNGVVGEVTGDYKDGRVGVRFPEPFGTKPLALRPENIGPEMTYEDRCASLMAG